MRRAAGADFGSMRLPLICAVVLGAAHAQQPQNPSPMVEHTRAHPRLKEQSPSGRREKLALGTLFLPAGMKIANGGGILFFFLSRTLLPVVAGARGRRG